MDYKGEKHPYFIIMLLIKYIWYAVWELKKKKKVNVGYLLILLTRTVAENFEKNTHFTKAIIHFYFVYIALKIYIILLQSLFFIKIYFFTKVYALI